MAKAPTGIRGFDELTGGLPHGRATLVTGGPGSCKTLFGLEFLVRGAQEFDEPGVLAFEESAADLTANVASLGFDLAGLEADGRLVIDAVRIDASEIVTTGTSTSTACSSAWRPRCSRWAPDGWSWTRSRCCSAHWATRRSCGTSSAGCCGG